MSDVGRSIRLIEVAPRDGLQNEDVEVATDDKVELIHRLADAGLAEIEVTSFVHPAKVPAMADADEVARRTADLGRVRRSALVLNVRGAQRAIDAGISEVNAVVCCTDTFGQRNQGTTVAQGLATWHEISLLAEREGIRASVTLAVAFGCPFEGEVAPNLVAQVARVAAEVAPQEISLADTIGVAVPVDVARVVAAVRQILPDGPALRAHFHDTRHAGVANALAAIDEGVEALDSSVGGLGGCPFAPGATGNVATEDLLYALHRSGITPTADLARVIEVSAWLETILGRPVRAGVRHAGAFPAPGDDLSEVEMAARQRG